jgi:hypothetical protein
MERIKNDIKKLNNLMAVSKKYWPKKKNEQLKITNIQLKQYILKTATDHNIQKIFMTELCAKNTEWLKNYSYGDAISCDKRVLKIWLHRFIAVKLVERVQQLITIEKIYRQNFEEEFPLPLRAHI